VNAGCWAASLQQPAPGPTPRARRDRASDCMIDSPSAPSNPALNRAADFRPHARTVDANTVGDCEASRAHRSTSPSSGHRCTVAELLRSLPRRQKPGEVRSRFLRCSGPPSPPFPLGDHPPSTIGRHPSSTPESRSAPDALGTAEPFVARGVAHRIAGMSSGNLPRRPGTAST